MKYSTIITWIGGLSLVLFSHMSQADAQQIQIEEVSNFQTLSKQMQTDNVVLVLEFSAKHCRYCKQLESEILKPMLFSGDYEDLIQIKKIEMDSEAVLKGFKGEITSGKALAEKMDIMVTPTLVFLNAQGKEVSERIVGINTPEMFSAYVDAAIDEAHQSLSQSLVLAPTAKLR
jgi:thioredoxin-related protein